MTPAFYAFVIVYGALKTGKTASVLAAFHHRAIYVAAPGALACASGLWGFEVPRFYDLGTIEDIIAFVRKLKPGEASALVVDDATLIVDRTVADLTARFGDSRNGYLVWEKLLAAVLTLRDLLRHLGMHCVLTTHEVPPEIKNGVRLRGGPAFPGQTRSKLPAAVDMLLRTELHAADPLGAPSFLGWPVVFRTGQSPDWLIGDRFHCAPDPSPMNLGEILRIAGYEMPRLKGLEWQEPGIEGLAGLLQPQLGNADAVRGMFGQALAQMQARGCSEPHAFWAIRDAYDRAVLRNAQRVLRRGIWGL